MVHSNHPSNRPPKLSYSPSMRELTRTSSYYGNNNSNNSDMGNHPWQPLNPANLSRLSNKTIKFPTLSPKIGHDHHHWSDAGSDVFVTSSLPRRQTRALPQRPLTRHSSLNLQTHRQTDRLRNIAVVEPSRSFVYQGPIRRAQNRPQQSPWQPQEIRSQIAWQPPPEGAATVGDKPSPWEPNQQPLPPKQLHQQQPNNLLPRQQNNSNNNNN